MTTNHLATGRLLEAGRITTLDTATLAAAMDVLAREIDSLDGVANAAIAEAAERLRELLAEVERLSAENLHRYQRQAEATTRAEKAEAKAEQPAQGEAVANGRPVTYAEAVSRLLEILRLRDLSDLQIDAINVACQVLKAAPPAPSVPDGWKLVPTDAPDEMLRWLDGGIRVAFSMRETLRRRYAALLAAAPEVPRG